MIPSDLPDSDSDSVKVVARGQEWLAVKKADSQLDIAIQHKNVSHTESSP